MDVPAYLEGDDLDKFMLELAQWFQDHGAGLQQVRQLKNAAADIAALYREIDELAESATYE